MPADELPGTGGPAAVRAEDLAAFTRQLGAMLDAGVNVLRALRIASEYTGSARLIQVAREIGAALEEGQEFHEAIRPYPDLFDPFYQEMARQGETDGLLGQTLIAVAEYLEHSARESAAAPAGAGRAPGAAAPGIEPAAALAGSLGTAALLLAGLWGITLLAPAFPTAWLGPAALILFGAALLAAAGRMRRLPIPPAPAPPPISPAPPRKSRERRLLETEGLVRSALQDEEEQQASAGPGGAEAEEPARAGSPPDVPDPLDGDDFLPPPEPEPERKRFHL